jgi:hypothetical protein
VVTETPKAPEKRVNPLKLEKLKQRGRQIEEEVARVESEIAAHESALGDFVSVEETRRVTGLLEAKRQSLIALLSEWEAVAQSIETGG